MSKEELQASEIPYRLIRLPQYERDLKALKRLEPKLHEAVRGSLKQELETGRFDEIQGTGGWIKIRVASPSRNIGKSGGFRMVYLLFKVQRDIYLAAIYEHRAKADLESGEKSALKAASEAIKRAYGGGTKS